MKPGKLLSINLPAGEGCEQIIAVCRNLGISGATVFRGMDGRAPLIIQVVDQPDRIDSLIEQLRRIGQPLLLSVEPVQMLRVEKPR